VPVTDPVCPHDEPGLFPRPELSKRSAEALNDKLLGIRLQVPQEVFKEPGGRYPGCTGGVRRDKVAECVDGVHDCLVGDGCWGFEEQVRDGQGRVLAQEIAHFSCLGDPLLPIFPVIFHADT
jgi:hypothetical protein